MDETFARHLVDQRNRRAQRVLHAGRITGVDGRADVAQRAAQPRTHLAIALATFDVLTMSFQRGIVTSHLILVLSLSVLPGSTVARFVNPRL